MCNIIVNFNELQCTLQWHNNGFTSTWGQFDTKRFAVILGQNH